MYFLTFDKGVALSSHYKSSPNSDDETASLPDMLNLHSGINNLLNKSYIKALPSITLNEHI